MEIKHIDYNKLIDKAMHQVVRQSLEYAKSGQLPGEHHFYITFFTKYDGVKLSPVLLQRFPEQMTIVVQHQFENLTVDDKKLGITLTFSGVKERIEIPYHAIIAFQDPSVQFALQFKHELSSANNSEENIKTDKKPSSKKNNVVSLDKFRKNKTK